MLYTIYIWVEMLSNLVYLIAFLPLAIVFYKRFIAFKHVAWRGLYDGVVAVVFVHFLLNNLMQWSIFLGPDSWFGGVVNALFLVGSY